MASSGWISLTAKSLKTYQRPFGFSSISCCWQLQNISMVKVPFKTANLKFQTVYRLGLITGWNVDGRNEMTFVWMLGVRLGLIDPADGSNKRILNDTQHFVELIFFSVNKEAITLLPVQTLPVPLLSGKLIRPLVKREVAAETEPSAARRFR